MTDFVYPVNRNDQEKWPDLDVFRFFGGLRTGKHSMWVLGNSERLIEPNDRIWVHAVQPDSCLVGVGMAADWPSVLVDEGQKTWQVEIKWDVPLTRFLLAHRSRSPENLFFQIQSPQRVRADAVRRLRKWLADLGAPEPESLPNERLRLLQEVAARQRRADFRRNLMLAYGGRCAITGCVVEAALQAAHIDPSDGPQLNRVSNGLLLRADVHNLFDKGLIWIDGRYRVHLSPLLDDDDYQELESVELLRPVAVKDRPDKEGLRRHRDRVAVRYLA